jgi:murein DD-endopeptidase MepM/ murein hydrolase activator NlpD
VSSPPIRGGYLIKIVPPVGYRVFRLELKQRHLAFATLVALAVLVGCGGWFAWTIHHAEARVGELRTLTDEQRARLLQIDSQAVELDSELRDLEAQNRAIRKLIGDPASSSAANAARADGPQSMRERVDFDAVAARIDRLRRASARAAGESAHLQRLALHVLNVRRIEDLARARVLSAIPSLNPAGDGVGIRSSFGWRVDPWPEFHRGVDLAADYGEPVRAAAAGTVVEAGYDGGYGIKIDVDHGNGYHTWYCHLSRADVHPGQYVTKAERIGLVGSTGASTGPHLHYQIMLDGSPVDPVPYLTGVPPRVLASLR